MKYERPIERSNGPKQFDVGTHAAIITRVVNLYTKKKKQPMFMIHLEGANKESGVAFLIFGNDYTKETLSFILASIEDNGVDIPDISYGYNVETAAFLTGKDVYIEVIEREEKGEIKRSVDKFLTMNEFEEIGMRHRFDTPNF